MSDNLIINYKDINNKDIINNIKSNYNKSINHIKTYNITIDELNKLKDIALKELDNFLVEFNKVFKQVYEIAIQGKKQLKKLNKIDRKTFNYSKGNYQTSSCCKRLPAFSHSVAQSLCQSD